MPCKRHHQKAVEEWVVPFHLQVQGCPKCGSGANPTFLLILLDSLQGLDIGNGSNFQMPSPLLNYYPTLCVGNSTASSQNSDKLLHFYHHFHCSQIWQVRTSIIKTSCCAHRISYQTKLMLV